MSDELTKPAVRTLSDVLKARKRTIESILGRSINPVRFLSLISSALQQTPKLMECTPISVVNCVLHAAQMGLEIRKNSAYLVPFKNSREKRTDCNLLIDYRGKIGIAHRSNFVHDIEPVLVYARDQFEYEKGHQAKFRHVPLLLKESATGFAPVEDKDRGDVVLAYCVAKLSNGAEHYEVMTLEQIEAIRKRSRSAYKDGRPRSDSPWTTDWNQMARKTTVHRIFNYLPQDEAMGLSQEVDDRFEMEAELPQLMEPESSEEDEPMVRVLEKEEHAAALEQKGAEAKADLEKNPAARKTMNIKRHPPRTVDGRKIPVLDELPPPEQVMNGQKIFVGEKLYEFDEKENCWIDVPQ